MLLELCEFCRGFTGKQTGAGEHQHRPNGHHMCSHLLVPQTTPSSLLIFFSERETNVRSGRVASDATRP
jgi:hypothetical protein